MPVQELEVSQPSCIIVTGPGKTAHFEQYFKIELWVLKGRVALNQFFCREVTRCRVLAVSVQSFLSTVLS